MGACARLCQFHHLAASVAHIAGHHHEALRGETLDGVGHGALGQVKDGREVGWAGGRATSGEVIEHRELGGGQSERQRAFEAISEQLLDAADFSEQLDVRSITRFAGHGRSR